MRRLRNILLTATALMPIAPALAGPIGGTVVGGSAQINNPGTANVTINQFSDKAIINWHMFNIGVGEKTTFVQPNSNSIALNRVVGGMGPSEILGGLDANGKVFVVNKDGIIFGAGAVVNTAGFLATTSDIRNEDFMAGRFNFNIPGRPDASIVNMGTITATSGGFAALVAPGVRNSGTITANLGTVTLASGNTFSLDFYGDRLVQLGVGDEIAGKVKDVATGQTLKSLVTNEGRLKANGGRVELTAAAARQVVDSVINTSGVVEANSVGVKNGQIVLAAATAPKSSAPGGRGASPSATAGLPPQKVKVSGTLSAAGKRAGTKGGTVTITGEHIEVAGATINASGREGGGKVLIGGDWAGGKPDTSLVSNQSAKLESSAIPTATTLSVDAATRIDASAKDKGDGGKVILWSDQTTSFAGTILALGGAQFGNGGFVETSGKGQLSFTGNVDTSAPNGKAGTLLLDPADFTIGTTTGPNSISNTDLQNQLATNNVTIATDNSVVAGNGDIFVNAPVIWNATTTLTLNAFSNIQLAFISGPGPGPGPNPTISNTNGGSLILHADSTGTGKGTVVLNAGTTSERIVWGNTGSVSIYYNPPNGYTSPVDYSSTSNTGPRGGFGGRVVVGSPSQLTAYMLVHDLANLASISTNLGGNYALSKDINAAGPTFTPLGTISTPFAGKFEGQGKTITGLNIVPSGSNPHVGMFGVIGAVATVSNFNLADVSVAATGSNQFLGPLAGVNNGTVTNVNVTASSPGASTVNAGPAFTGIIAGGLVGQNTGNLSIHNSSSAANVTIGNGVTGQGGGFNYAGGLAGQNAGTIDSKSLATGNVTGGTNAFVGGLVGQNSTGGIISGTSSASGNVSGGGSTGGLVGFNASGALITNASATGNVTGASSTAMVGGLVGQNEGSIANSTHATGTISGSGSGSQNIILGGLVGMNAAFGNVQNSTVSGTTINGNIATAGGLVGINNGHITGTNPGQVAANTTITLDGANSIGGGLVGQNNASGVVQNASASGSLNRAAGSQGLLMNFGGLVGWNLGSISNSTASTAVNGGAGNTGGLAGRNEGSIAGSSASGNVSATGTSSTFAWIGGLVGDNTATGTITNSTATGTVSTGGFANVGGLIGANTGNLSNLSVGNTSTVTTNGNSVTAGGLIGNNSGSLSNMSASNAVSASGNQVMIGGLVGMNIAGGTITNSQATGHVTSTFNATSMFDLTMAGGLVGGNFGTINGTSQPSGNTPCAAGASCATGNVSVGSHGMGGGLAGFNAAGTITNSFATGAVTGGPGLGEDIPTSLGGLVGLSSGGTISDSHARGAVGGNVAFLMAGGLVGDNGSTITNSLATGNVTTGNNSQAGGLVGGTGSDCAGCTGNISNSTARGNVSVGGTSVAGGLAGGVGEGASLSNTNASGAVTGGHDSVIGGLVGALAPGASITNSHSIGAVSGTGANVMAGGLVGISLGTISDAAASGQVTVASASYAGGLVGGNVGLVNNNSSASGAVNGGSNSVLGGLAGINAGTITQSSASGAVTTGNNGAAGGLVGANVVFEGVPPGLTLPGSSFPNGTIVSSSSTGAVTGGTLSNVGGLIGNNGGSISGLSSNATVNGGQNSFVGGLVGQNSGPPNAPAFPAAITGCQNCPFGSISISSDGGTIANSSASGQLTGGAFSIIGGLVGSNPGTITGSQSSVALNASNALMLGGLVGNNEVGGSIANSSATGNVSGTTPLAGALGGLAGGNLGSISGSSASGNVAGGPNTVVGGLVGYNTGNISNANATGSVTGGLGSTSGGLAGVNFGLVENSNASGNVTGGEGSTLGGLVGMNAGTITNSVGTGAVTADPSIGGGLVGINIGTIAGSHATGAVTGDDGSMVGGLVGFNILGSIQNSYSVSTVTTGAGGAAGGLVAINLGEINQSFAAGRVTGGDASHVGGLVAFNFGAPSLPGPSDPQAALTPPIGVISQSYATGAVAGGAGSVVGGLVAENAGSLDQTYAVGRVTGGTGSILGGLVASNNFNIPTGNPLFPPNAMGTTGTATNSYWDTQTTGQNTSAGGTGLQTTQLVNVIPSGFTPGPWTTSPGSYPFLAGQPNPLPVPSDPVVNPPPPPPPQQPTDPLPPPQQQPDRPLDNTTIVLISPQTNAIAATNGIGTEPKSSDVVINNQSGSGSGSGSGGSSPGGQKGGNQSGNAGRPPANAVAAYGLGPLPSGMPPADETRFLNDEVVFQLGGRLSDRELASLLNQLGLQVLYQEDIGLLGRKVLRLKLPGGATVRNIIAALERKGANFSGQPVYQFELTQDLAQAPSPADTNRRGDSAQYIVEKLGLPEAHLIATGKDVKVAVIDSEIDRQHPDLAGAIADNYDALPSDDQTAHPHGTGMAGAIASHRRLLGVAPNARILGVRAFGVNTGGAQGTSMNIVKGLQWAVDQGAKVINMSFAGPKDPILQQAMQRLTDQGIILIAAAGNAGPKSPPLFPGADPNVIAVSATDVDNKTYKNANRGKYVSISAPGVDILVPAPEGGYQLTTGTSVAAAHISGVVALMLERNKELKPSEVRSILTSTAKNIGGVKTDVGAGLVDPAAALSKAGPKSAGLR